MDIERLGRMADAARAEIAGGESFGDARVAFLIEFEDDVLFALVDGLRRCRDDLRAEREWQEEAWQIIEGLG